MVQMSFNAAQFTPRYSGSDGLPPGKHPVIISASEFRPTKDSSPSDPRMMLVFTLEAIGGPAKGGKQTDRLNIQNPNQQTVNIAMSQLAAYCAVTRRQGFNDTSELHNIPFMIEVGPQKNNADYTEVKGVYFLDGRDAASTSIASQGGAPTPPFAPAPVANSLGAAPPIANVSSAGYPSSPPFGSQPPQQFQPGPVAGKAPWDR